MHTTKCKKEKIKFLVMDVDGTMTDGKVYIGANGELMKVFSIKDGYAIRNLLPMADISPVIITGRHSEIVAYRAKELGIEHVFQAIENKLQFMGQFLEKNKFGFENVAVIGDDLNDYELMDRAALSGCPLDACEEVRSIADMVSTKKGGEGAVREFIEWIVERTD